MPNLETSTLAAMRQNYHLAHLDEQAMLAEPMAQFQAWLEHAISAKLPEPNAMTLATVNAEGQPSTRVVLLKGLDTGFIFYSNYQSRKGREIAANPRVGLNMVWLELQRQVRIEGGAEKMSRQASQAYFQSRPRASQLGALVSPQSEVIANRAVLDEQWAALSEKYPDSIPLPENWGGYRVIPERMEFWQGREGRLHDRLAYQRDSTGAWQIQRLAP